MVGTWIDLVQNLAIIVEGVAIILLVRAHTRHAESPHPIVTFAYGAGSISGTHPSVTEQRRPGDDS